MNDQQFWQLIAAARNQAADPDASESVAREATALPATRPVREIVAAQQVLWDLMADSYRNPLWAAAYVINGGCSDDGFDYFRGWLIAQGRDVFERVVADPDALAELPVVQASAASGQDLEGEDTLSIAWNAHIAATGEQLPADAFTIRYPELGSAWDFDDRAQMARGLPRLTALYLSRPDPGRGPCLYREQGCPLTGHEDATRDGERGAGACVGGLWRNRGARQRCQLEPGMTIPAG